MRINKILLIMLVTMLTNFSSFAQFQSWFKIGDMPYPVAGARAIVVDTTIYVIGGYSDSLNANVDWIQAYYPNSSTWEIVGYLPEARYGFIAGVMDDKLVICGGVDDPEQEKFSLRILSHDSTGFSFYSDTSFIYNRVFSAGLVQDGNLYIFGGLPASGITDTLEKSYIVRYDLSAENTVFENQTLYSNGEFPIQQMTAYMGNDIYLLGGVHNGILKQIYKFSPDSNYYVKMNINLQEPRAGGEAIVFQEAGEIYLIGGYNENSDAVFTVERLTFFPGFIMSDQQEPLLEARKEFMAVRYGEFMFVMGGRDRDNKVIRSIEIMEHQWTTSVNDHETVNDYFLYQNYPNPFNPGTMINFMIPQQGKVKLTIYSVMGEIVKEFEETEFQAGVNKIYWNGTNNTGSVVSAGVYLSRLEFNNRILTGKMLLVK